jgi:hypothetical protein
MMAKGVLAQKLDFWVNHNKNVLFIGKHGVGKTAMVKDAFERHKLNYRYFSASTMDPWVDFVGVPREKTDNKIPEQFDIIRELASISKTLAVEWIQSNWKMTEASAVVIVNHSLERKEGMTYLDLVRPASFAAGEVEALFFDEFNRSPKKVRNAVMELMQFKSINGFKFPNLRMIWAAINPDDDEDETYDVERLDPAQADRYHISVIVPYEPNVDWFRTEYGQRIADSACQWWDELPAEQKNEVSPRRLQYALDVFRERGDMRDVLPLSSNVTKLSSALNTGPTSEKLEALMQTKDVAEARSFLSNENNYSSAMKFIPKAETLIAFFLPLLPKEKLSTIMSDDDKLGNYILNNSDRVPIFREVCKEIIHANTNQRICKKIRKVLQENTALSDAFASDGPSAPAAPHFNKAKTGTKAWGPVLAELQAAPKQDASQRIAIYDKIVTNIPEKMTGQEALNCLIILDGLFAGSFSFSSSLSAKPFEKLMGVINQCISELHRNTGMDWGSILSKHGSHFKGLLEKIKLAGLIMKLYQPSK